ncbi:MAG: type I-C CRISPR-associated protein Cas8c/Csd1 [Deltaproteobacteria bacterium]|nr:type I-C CRISPR-associated protein Cas8c/Csd1 [Deltaproteobacteria bacterium]
MILQALKEYYDRKPDLPREGWELKEIPYVVVLRPDGETIGLECTYEGAGRERRARAFLVPQAVKRSSGIAANLLWDTLEYAIGVGQPGKKRSVKKSEENIRQRVAEMHAAFVKRLEDLGTIEDSGFHAIKKFLREPDKAKVLQTFGETWTQLLNEGGNLSFKLAGDSDLIVNRLAVRQAIAVDRDEKSQVRAVCLVTGEQGSIERLHPAVKGVWGAQTSGANVVSFNLEAFGSFGKTQGENAPVGKTSAFGYTTALNSLLGKGSKQRMQVGDASTVFWAAKNCSFEGQFLDFFGEPQKDDPDRGTRAVESLFKSVETGAFSTDADDTKFYVLGLAPNASRIAVRFWIASTVSGMAGKVRQHFEDTRIAHGPKDRDTLSLFRLLLSTAVQGKAENIPPNLGGDTMRAILEGWPYPQTLLQAAVRRIRAEHNISYPRAALIKACINRQTRHQTGNHEEELEMSLDLDNENIGYRLGRLFATLEKVQQEANPGINATIRDKFYGAASSTPVTVFGNLMRLKNHHIAKLDSRGRAVNMERLIGEILRAVTDFPPHLALADQGRFAIGYYHQMQEFFTKKIDKANDNATKGE